MKKTADSANIVSAVMFKREKGRGMIGLSVI